MQLRRLARSILSRVIVCEQWHITGRPATVIKIWYGIYGQSLNKRRYKRDLNTGKIAQRILSPCGVMKCDGKERGWRVIFRPDQFNNERNESIALRTVTPLSGCHHGLLIMVQGNCKQPGTRWRVSSHCFDTWDVQCSTVIDVPFKWPHGLTYLK